MAEGPQVHRGHLWMCALGLVAALGYVALSGGSPGGIGIVVAALVCPIAMLLAMKLLMGGDRREHDAAPVDSTPADGGAR